MLDGGAARASCDESANEKTAPGAAMTRFADLVEASTRAAQTASRLGKRDAIAACLRAAAPDEVEIAVAFLSGET
ncbi:hypothetical protein FBR04_14480, partial [Betaproteobacteria bacterium PRO7]|nr:hypothetical protein [Betaproteobacteria bacterium PRO7]